MKLYHVVAVAGSKRVIGKDNKLPWHFPEDLKFFKTLTTGSTVIMGRKTFESIGRPLPNRKNMVLSRKAPSIGLPMPEKPLADIAAAVNKDVLWAASLDQALGSVETEKAFIIGGAELYRETIRSVDGIYMTRIDAEYEGDAFYPEIPADLFEEISVDELRRENPRIEIVFYEKKESAQ